MLPFNVMGEKFQFCLKHPKQPEENKKDPVPCPCILMFNWFRCPVMSTKVTELAMPIPVCDLLMQETFLFQNGLQLIKHAEQEKFPTSTENVLSERYDLSQFNAVP